MANQAHMEWLKDGSLRAKSQQGPYASFDFSGEAVNYDFSELKLTGCNFRGCDLRGSKFRRTRFDDCFFADSSWGGADFAEATFSNGNYRGVRNPDRAFNLNTARAYGFENEFETAQPSNMLGFNFDWELIGKVGKLPLFGVSSATLILMPIFFYLTAHYNRTLASLREAFPLSADNAIAIAVGKLPILHTPSLSFLTLVAAFSLAVASAIYSFACPPLPKEFSLTQWQYQLEKSPIPYKAQAWAHRWLRVICVIFYCLGGGLGAYVLSIKLWRTAKYILLT